MEYSQYIGKLNISDGEKKKSSRKKIKDSLDIKVGRNLSGYSLANALFNCISPKRTPYKGAGRLYEKTAGKPYRYRHQRLSDKEAAQIAETGKANVPHQRHIHYARKGLELLAPYVQEAVEDLMGAFLPIRTIIRLRTSETGKALRPEPVATAALS